MTTVIVVPDAVPHPFDIGLGKAREREVRDEGV
jgi:hypothetical protein